VSTWNGIRIFIGFLLTFSIFGGTTIYLVGFCSVWYEWTYTVLFGWVMSFMIDFLLLETTTEGMLALMFSKKDSSEIFK